MKLRLALALILLAAITRLALNFLPYPPHNFSPIAAMGLFGAAVFNRRWMALAVPFAALFLSDLVLNNVIYSQYYPAFTLVTSWWIYAAFGLVMLVGWAMLRLKASPGRVVLASLISSAVFFLITNYSVWATGLMYPKDATGLIACYAAGIPFLGNTILGDLFFSSALFGVYHWVGSRQLRAQTL